MLVFTYKLLSGWVFTTLEIVCCPAVILPLLRSAEAAELALPQYKLGIADGRAFSVLELVPDFCLPEAAFVNFPRHTARLIFPPLSLLARG